MITVADLDWLLAASTFLANHPDDPQVVKCVAEDIKQHLEAIKEEDM